MFKEYYPDSYTTKIEVPTTRSKLARFCDYFIFLGFAFVLGVQIYTNFGGPKLFEKAFVGPPKPVYLSQR